MAKSGPQQVTLDLGMLESVAKSIDEIDTKISAASGSDAAIRKQIAEGLATQHSETVDNYVNSLADSLAQMSVDMLVGLKARLDQVLSDRFDDAIKEFLDSKVAEATAGDKDDLTKLRDERKKLVEEFRSVQTILTTFGVDTSSVPEPKRRASSGSGGGATAAKTGKNKEGYRYRLDGADRPNSQNSISSLAFYATSGCEGGQGDPPKWTTAQLKEFIASNGVEWGVTDDWDVQLPNGKVIGARRFTDEERAEQDAMIAEAKASASHSEPTDSTESHEAADGEDQEG